MFDIPGSKFKVFGQSGAGILSKPIGIDVSESGEVFVIDTTAKRVVVYDADGKYLRTFGGKSLFERPTGLAVSNGQVYVSDTGRVTSQGEQGHKIEVFDAKSGEHLSTIGKRGVNDGEFNFPLMIETDKNGELYVIDSANFRVQRFDAEGKYSSSFGKVGTQFGNFSRPKGIAVDDEGKIYVVDTAFANFQIFNNEGQLLMFIGNRSSRNEPGSFALPAGIDVDEDGRIYVVDQAFGKIEVFRPYEMKASEGYAGVKNPEK
jgi:DNA-binding beta-propeller fold protein YncE